MATAALRFANEDLLAFLDDLYAKFDDLRPLLTTWGEYQVGRVKRRFQEKGPGWPAKHPYFAELERRSGAAGNAPLNFRGHLKQSITFDVGSKGTETLRVGSPLVYSARQQFGDEQRQYFYLYILADRNPDGTIQRDEQGRILGKLVLKEAAEGWFKKSTDMSAPARGKKSAFSKINRVYRQLIGVKITARPFLLEPDQREEQEMIEIAEKFLIDSTGKPGKGGSA